MSQRWQECLDSYNTQALGGTIYRVVESQKIIATRSLVDDVHEQQLLEELLEQSKPRIAPEFDEKIKDLDYLLWTPFRYPPLRFGSRFSTRFERGLFYAARSIATALAETAYYRFFFWLGMSVPPPRGKLETQHTAFGANILTNHGVRLQAEPFDQHQQALTDRFDYQACQELGKALRADGVKAFEFMSARDTHEGINIALVEPSVFKSKRPESHLHIICTTTADEVVFLDEKNQKTVHPMSDFLVDDVFPQPAG